MEKSCLISLRYKGRDSPVSWKAAHAFMLSLMLTMSIGYHMIDRPIIYLNIVFLVEIKEYKFLGVWIIKITCLNSFWQEHRPAQKRSQVRKRERWKEGAGEGFVCSTMPETDKKWVVLVYYSVNTFIIYWCKCIEMQ